MGMCKRRMLSFVLTLALVVGCFTGTGISVKATETSSMLQGRVVDKNGEPVSGVKFKLKEKGSYDEIAAYVTSENGQIIYDVKSLADGQYFLDLASEDYECLDVSYYMVHISGGSITVIKDWNDKAVDSLEFTVEKINESEPVDPAKQSITIKLVDEPGGALVTDPAVKLQVEDYMSDSDSYPLIDKETPVNGEYTYTVSSDAGVKIVIRLDEDVTGYEANPIELRLNNSMIDKVIVNGQERVYDGTPQEMVVTPVGLTANITKVTATPDEILASGGEVQLSITGTDTTAANWGVDVQSVISGTEQKPGDKAGQAVVEQITKKNAVIKISENETEDKIEFTFVVGPKDEDGKITKQASVKVTQAGKASDNKPGTGDSDNKPGTGDSDNKPGTGDSDNKPGTGDSDNKPGTGDSNNNHKDPSDESQGTQTVKVSSIKLSADSKEVAAGKKIKLITNVFPANATNKSVTYKSSNAKYASVDAAGKVTVKKAGAGKTVTITATAADGSGKSASYKIKIMKNAVKNVKVKAAKSVKAGKKIKVKVTIKTTGKKANKKLKWTSSNTKYATVSSKGVVKTKKAGKGRTVKITAAATDGSGKKSTVKIKIK